MAGSSTLEVFVGIVLVLHALGSVFQITRGESTAEGECSWTPVYPLLMTGVCFGDRDVENQVFTP